MTIVGFNFTKIKAKRNEDIKKGKVEIKNNVALTSVEEGDLNLTSSKQKVAKIGFDFDVNYEPNIGGMHFSGNILYLEEAAKVDEVIKEFEKNKKLNTELMTLILNTVLNKCNIQAVIMSQQINLPSPLPMPKVGIKQPAKK